MSGRIAAVALAALLLAGCSSAPVPPPMLSIDADNCAAQPDLAQAQALVLAKDADDAKPVATTFDAKTACFAPTPGAKALYRVFALPQETADYTVSVASAPFGQGIFAPDVSLLDADGKVLRTIPREKFVFRGNALTILFRSHPDEHYLLVSSDPNELGKTFERTQEATQVYTGSTGFGTYQIHTGTDTTNQYIYTANGNVSVTLMPIPVANPKQS